MNLIAINTITRAVKPGKAATRDTPAVPPKTETIAPGEKFEATKEEADELISMKAASEDKDGAKKKAAPTKSDSAAAAAQQAAKGEASPEDMTVDDIKAELDELEAEYPSSANKPELVKLLTEARAGDLV